MAFQVKSEHIDAHAGVHVIYLHDPESKREHIVQVHIGLDACPTCGHITPRKEFDPAFHLKNTIDHLNDHHNSVLAYAAKHRVAIKPHGVKA